MPPESNDYPQTAEEMNSVIRAYGRWVADRIPTTQYVVTAYCLDSGLIAARGWWRWNDDARAFRLPTGLIWCPFGSAEMIWFPS